MATDHDALLDRAEEIIRFVDQNAQSQNDVDSMLQYLSKTNEVPIEISTHLYRKNATRPVFGGDARGVVGQVAQGATLQNLDELTGFGRSFGGVLRGDYSPEDYERYRNVERRALDEFEQRHGGTSAVAQAVGEFGLPFGTGRLARLAGAGRVGGRLPKPLQTAVGEGAMYGAGAGALSGFGEAPEMGDMTTYGLLGAGTGAATGGIAGGTADMLSRLTGVTKSPQVRAATRINRALKSAGLDVDSAGQALARRRARAPNQPVVLADLSPSAQRLARAVHAKGGPGADAAEQFLVARDEWQGARIAQFAQDGLATGDDTARKLASRIAERKENEFSAAYDAIRRRGDIVRITPDMREVFNTRQGQNAFKKLVNLETVGYRAPSFDDYYIKMEDGTRAFNPLVTQMPLMDLHKYQQSIGDIGYKAGAEAAGSTAAAARSLRTSFMNDLKRQNEPYRLATKDWADAYDLEEALDFGKKFSNADPDDIADFMQRARGNEAKLHAYRTGVLSSIKEDIDKTRFGADVVKRIWTSPRKKAALMQAMGDPKRFREFEELIKYEIMMRRTNDMVRGGSPTARILKDLENLDSMSLDEVLNVIVAPGTSWTTQILEMMSDFAKNSREAVRQRTAEDLQGIMFNPNAAEVNRALAERGEALAQLRRMRGAGQTAILPGLAVMAGGSSGGLLYPENTGSWMDEEQDPLGMRGLLGP